MKKLKALALDVDGVLTDNCFTWDARGGESKRFSFRDVMGISIARKAGFLFALISGETTPLVDRYAAKMSIADVHKGCKEKAAALREFAARHGLALEEVGFMGDDVNDVGALAIAGFAAAPADAHPKARQAAAYVTEACGGHGSVREVLDYLSANGLADCTG